MWMVPLVIFYEYIASSQYCENMVVQILISLISEYGVNWWFHSYKTIP